MAIQHDARVTARAVHAARVSEHEVAQKCLAESDAAIHALREEYNRKLRSLQKEKAAGQEQVRQLAAERDALGNKIAGSTEVDRRFGRRKRSSRS